MLTLKQQFALSHFNRLVRSTRRAVENMLPPKLPFKCGDRAIYYPIPGAEAFARGCIILEIIRTKGGRMVRVFGHGVPMLTTPDHLRRVS